MSNTISEYYNGTRSNVAEFLPEKYSRVLEIGCGSGGFRDNLTLNCEYWGIEPHRPAYEIASQKLDNVFNGTYDEFSEIIPNNYFDLVICNDVIEHMADHDNFLNEIKLKMAKGAYLVGSLPNVRYFPNLISLIFEKNWKYQDAGILDRTHLRFFTEKSILETFNHHSFIINDFSGINSISYKPTSLRKILKILAIKALGKDTQFLQFAFRLQKNKA